MHVIRRELAVVPVQGRREPGKPSPNANVLIVWLRFKSVRTWSCTCANPICNERPGETEKLPGTLFVSKYRSPRTPLVFVPERLLRLSGNCCPGYPAG